jgi:hypothetical protein
MRRRSPSPAQDDTMDGVEYTARSGRTRRLSSSKYDQLRRERRCFKCKHKGHFSTACPEDAELLKKTTKTVGVAKANSSSTKKKIRKDRKEESSDEESSRVETLDNDSNSGKE